MLSKLFLTLTAGLLLAACGGAGNSNDTPTSPGPAPATPSPTPAPSPTPSPTTTPTSVIQGQAVATWQLPTLRENGTPLLTQEIGGFEIRYRKLATPDFTYLVVEGTQHSYTFDNLYGEFVFQIAAYDNNGLYSQFVPLTVLH
ncbi:hypothetical protein L1F30_14480 [Simiduia sp. 21SJ11W-1]|uniref:hypothetical protein n=1 Tax=Simiduia sp. 21SJ11W-1 TaxID=2909669 RepID=UPI0020A1E56D|nr:hypothetical protein [Simiduia sp. 21SJ11W-1]UTA47356.1 hypothetical protein L1F30_14480 [Simiduia sp. 21SJ11W-1]